MIDLHLPIEIISNIFSNKEDVKDFKTILEKIEPGKKIDIYYDRLKLQELFLNLNPQVFSSTSFRKILLDSNYKTKNFRRFANELGIKEEITEANKAKIIKKSLDFSWGSNKETRSFINNFELNESIMPENLSGKLEFEEFPPANKPYEEMFQYQSDVFHEALNLLKKPNQGFIIQIPTGGGKTKMAMELVVNQFNTKNNQKILWVADRKELCQQATNGFEKIWRHKGVKKVVLNRCWEKFNFMPDLKGNILIVATIDKILNLKKRNIAINSDIIIFDEAHHASAKKYKSALIFARKNGTNTFGLTATPGRSYDNEEENEELSSMFDDTLLRIKDTYAVSGKKLGSIAYLQSKGILSKPIRKPEIMIPKLKTIFTSKDLKRIEKNTDYSLKDLERIGRDNIRNLKIIEELIKIAKTGKQILFFGTSVTQSKLMYATMKHLGFSGVHIDGKTNPEFRSDNIQKFVDSKIQILFNYQVLATGFDAPSVEVVFIARPTKSPVLLLQMIGRGMRGKAVGGTETFDLYYVKDGIFENFVDLDELFEMFSVYFEHK